MYYRARPLPYWKLVIRLMGHLLGTATIFVALFTFGWGISYCLHLLHRTHPFPAEIFEFATTIELYLVYLDVGLSAIVLLSGMYRFGRDLLEYA